jgi:hypothetical protein|tara:strand:- start:1713 stop:2141 length:429 start_codon:yes stop_codon:yes gene_type:complete
MKMKKGNKRRNTRVKAVRDERYAMLDIRTSVRSELQGSEFIGLLGGDSDCGVNHYNCEHRDVTHLFTKVSPIKPQLAYSEKEKASRVFNSAMMRTILKLRDWSVLSSRARQGYTILHPRYLTVVSMVSVPPSKEVHEYRHKR